MAIVYKSVLLPYSAQQMYALVSTVKNYPEFLPWCERVHIHTNTDTDIETKAAQKIVATLSLNYHGVKQSFTTENTHHPFSEIHIKLVDGPFRTLDGLWKFIPLADDACKIEFNLHYEFSNKLLERLIDPVFHKIANSFVDSFCVRAQQIYGVAV